jgi:hypothetical protein
MKFCKTCFQAFEPTTPTNKFCSKKCRPSQLVKVPKKQKNKICLFCEKPFEQVLSGREKLYCSRRCRSDIQQARIIEQRPATVERICKNCGKGFIKLRQSQQKVCSDACYKHNQKNNKCLDCEKSIQFDAVRCRNCHSNLSRKFHYCEVCQNLYKPTYNKQRTCGRDCGKKINSRNQVEKILISKVFFKHCIVCKSLFASNRKAGQTCKDQNCKDELIRISGRQQYKKNPDRFKRAAHRRRSLFLSAFVEDVSLDYIGNRDKWICHLCNEKIDSTLTSRNPMMPSLDHVLPLSKGGEHSNKNVRISHLRCNLKKHNQIIGEPMLFG